MRVVVESALGVTQGKRGANRSGGLAGVISSDVSPQLGLQLLDSLCELSRKSHNITFFTAAGYLQRRGTLLQHS